MSAITFCGFFNIIWFIHVSLLGSWVAVLTCFYNKNLANAKLHEEQGQEFLSISVHFLRNSLFHIYFVLESIAHGFICPDMICDFLIFQRKVCIMQGN